VIRASLDDVERINELSRRHFEQEADFTGFLSNSLNVAILVEGGGICFVWHGPGIYEAHCCFEQRGGTARDIAARILSLLRDDYGARLIWAAIPNEKRHVKTFARWLGFRPAGLITLPSGANELFKLENW
jgi:hypothetical protein